MRMTDIVYTKYKLQNHVENGRVNNNAAVIWTQNKFSFFLFVHSYLELGESLSWLPGLTIYGNFSINGFTWSKYSSHYNNTQWKH